jgi:hypothetical protein
MFERRVARIEPWGAGDLPLLEQLNDPEMTKHVGGPESPGKLAERHSRYVKADSRQYRIVDERSGEGVGWVGYWETTWHDQPVWETGWAVLPSFQGRGIASSATAQLLDRPGWNGTTGSCTRSPWSRTPRRTRSAESSASRCSARSTSLPAAEASSGATTGATISWRRARCLPEEAPCPSSGPPHPRRARKSAGRIAY